MIERWLPDALAGSGREVHAVGDCIAARQAPAAIHEGRKLALSLQAVAQNSLHSRSES